MEPPVNAPRVLVGCPTHELKEDSINAYVSGLSNLTYPHFDVVLEDNSPTPVYAQKLEQLATGWMEKNPGRTFRVIHTSNASSKARARIVEGRNKIREIVLQEEYDYFLSLEQDIVPPPQTIEQLLSHQKDIVSGAYYNKRTEKNNTVHFTLMAGTFFSDEEKINDKVRSMGFLELFPTRVEKVAYGGMGCMLIHRRILEQVSFRYDENELASDDVYFSKDAREKGFETYLDTGLLCQHLFNDAFKKTRY